LLCEEVCAQLTLDYIRKSILGKVVSVEPILELKPNSYVVTEVRSWNSRKPRDWAVKIYGREVREVPAGEIIRESTNRILQVFAEQEFRFVLMARSNL
jgi:hypothetical protein